MPKNNLGGVAMVEVTKRDEVIEKEDVERFEVETGVQTVLSTVSVVLSCFFSFSWDFQGMTISLRELMEVREVVSVLGLEYAGTAYASSLCGYAFLSSLVHLECADLSAYMD